MGEERTRFVELSQAASVPTRIRESAVTIRTFSVQADDAVSCRATATDWGRGKLTIQIAS